MVEDKNVVFAEESEDGQQIDDNMKLLKNLRFQHIVDINMVRIFVVVWLVISVAAAVPILRPSYSEIEKRELNKFPEFSIKALFSGDYFDDINLWFSDTFPFRDKFVLLNTSFTNAFGVNRVQVHGNVEVGDDIPDVESSSVVESAVSSKEESSSSEPTDSETELIIPESSDLSGTESQEELKEESSSEVQSETESAVETEVPSSSEETVPSEPIVEQLGAILIADNAAYEYYTFNQAVAEQYSAAINRAAALLAGKSTVYNMIIPTSTDITMPENFRAQIKSSDQKKAIEYMYSLMSPEVLKVDCFTALKSRSGEYIYFRTDHHWTALGAYYAYRELMSVKGTVPAELSAFIEYRFEGYLGSFYSQSEQRSQLAATPDYVLAYEPTQLKRIHTFTPTGEIDFPIIRDANEMSTTAKYLTFVGGDNPYGIMTNPTITDNSSCLVIKESFGNAMVAYLTQHYQNVYVVDYRYISKVFPGTLVQFVDERAINDVIFINNVSATRSPKLTGLLSSFVG